MSRRPTNANAGVSLFPFLAVLLCTMGSLVLLLMLVASQTKAQAQKERESAAKPKVDLEAIRRREEDLQWKIDQLAKSRDKTLVDVADHRAQLSHLEEHTLRLKKQLADLDAASALLKSQASTDAAGRGALQADLDELRRKIAEAEKKLAAEKAAGRKPQAFAVVPFDGDNGTRRRPIYIECRSDSIVLQPEGIKFVESDFAGSLGPSNPLATAVRLTSEYLTRGETYREGEQPYPLMLVRPSGISSYYAARAGMSSWEGEFGYELIDEDWPLEFPPADPLLSQMLVRAVEEARVRQVMLARAAPSIRNRGPKATFRVGPSGGIVQEGGGSYGGGRGGRLTSDRGPRSYQAPSGGGGYSSTREPDEKFATVGNSSGGTGGANGPPGYGGDAGRYPGVGGTGQPSVPQAAPGAVPSGELAAVAPTIDGNGNGGAGLGNGVGTLPSSVSAGGAASGGTLGERYGGVPNSGAGGMAGGGTSNSVGDRYAATGTAPGGYPGQPTSGGPSLGAADGMNNGGQTSGNPMSGAPMSGAAGGLGSNGANSYVGGGAPSGVVGMGDSNMVAASSQFGSGNSAGNNNFAGQSGFANGYSSTRNTGEGVAGGVNTGPNGARGMQGGSANTSSGVVGAGNGTSDEGSAGGAPSSGGKAGVASSGGGGTQSGSGQPSGGMGGAGGDPGAAPNFTMDQQVPPPGPGEYRESLADKRGKNWGLPEEARRSTPITRPIQLYCTANNLTVLTDKGVPDKQIVMEGPTENSVDTLVSTIWDQVGTWGIAGRGMYWKPKLVVHVSPDGAARFNDLKQLLDGSGLEVSGKQIAVAQPVAHGRR